MRVLVCGGRRYPDPQNVWNVLDKVHRKHKVTALIHGYCPSGADAHAHKWARSRGVQVDGIAAEWGQLGLKAGPIRNQRLIDEKKPEAGVAFPGGVGTADMVRRLKEAGIPVWELDA